MSRPRSYFNSEPFALTPSDTNTTSSMSASLPQSQYYTQSPRASKHHSSSNQHPSREGSTSALASLRELSAALDSSKSSSSRTRARNGSINTSDEDDSAPASPTLSRSGSAVWSYMPFTSTTNNANAMSPPPRNGGIARSYTQPPASTAYGSSGYSVNGYGANGYSYNGYGATGGISMAVGRTPGAGMDRPLPPRSGGYGHRPRSMDLVTPFSNGA